MLFGLLVPRRHCTRFSAVGDREKKLKNLNVLIISKLLRADNDFFPMPREDDA